MTSHNGTNFDVNNWPEFAAAFKALPRWQRAEITREFLGERLGRELRIQQNQACTLIEEIWRGNIEEADLAPFFA